jgi:hypothetical protein
MRDRDDLHLLGVVKAEIEMAGDATFVTQVANLGDTAALRRALTSVAEGTSAVVPPWPAEEVLAIS